jgi:hypothetical protein
MKPVVIIASLWLTTLLIPSTSFSHEEAEIPSTSAKTGYVYIANRTNGDVIFHLVSANTIRTKHHLPPHSGATFSGASADSWFNIRVYNDDTPKTYGLDAGMRYYLDRDPAGVLKVYKIPMY